MREIHFSKAAGMALLAAVILSACVPQPAEDTMTTAETASGTKRITNPIVEYSSIEEILELPEIDSETRELIFYMEGVETPVIIYRYEIHTVANEGYDALKKALEDASAELEIHMQAEYDHSVRNRQMDQNQGADYDAQWVREEHLEITRSDGSILSGYEDYYQYMGGTHPGTLRQGITYDVATGERLELLDIVEDYDELYQEVLDYLENDFPHQEGLFADYRETVEKFFYPPENAEYPYVLQWYLTDESIVIYFNEYEIGPYAMGPVAVEIPFGIG